MTRKNYRIVSILLLLACMLTVTTAGAYGIVPYASDQIDAYDGNAIASGGGQLAIQFSIEGTGIMKAIGSSQIKIYEKYGKDGWMIAKVFTEKDEGMTVSGRNAYGTTMYYDGIKGTQYKVVITVFATDYDNVKDSRTVTRYVTA
ncbi:MAG: hypothetical protein K1W20_04310 [Lachnospiraceae bacterium]